MRRAIIMALLFLFPIAAAAPAFAGSGHGYTPPHAKAKVCKKVKNGKHGYKTVCKVLKKAKPKAKHPTAVPTKTKSKKHKRTVTKTATPKPTVKPTSTSTPTSTPTLTATATATNTVTATATATQTPTLIPTPANTPTATSSLAGLPVVVQAPGFDHVAFYVCGLPTNANAVFSPDPSVAQPSSQVRGSIAYAHSTLITSIPPSVRPGVYYLPIRAYLENAQGSAENFVPGAADFSPQTAVLTVNADRTTALVGSSDFATATTNCSSLPTGFGPRTTPTPTTNSYQATASLSDTHPQNNEVETVTGKFTVNNQPLAGVPMHTQWYTYRGILSCDSVTDIAGTARCAERVQGSIPTYSTLVIVTFLYNGNQYSAYASYTT